jgi:hypothetical protein
VSTRDSRKELIDDRMGVTMEGREDQGGILLIIDNLDEAKSIAEDLRERGVRVVVRLLEDRDRNGAVTRR